MNRLFAFVLLLCLTAATINAAENDKTPVLVNDQWLAEHLHDPNLVVLSVTQNARMYRNGHVPGARFLWVTRMAASNPELSFELVPLEQLDTLLEGLGISNNSRIILCGAAGNVSATARVYVTLEYLGMEKQTSILDGGVEGWKAAGNPVSTDVPTFARGTFTPHVKQDAIVDADYVKSHIDKKGTTIVDARAPDFYLGKNSGGYPRAGHIPSAHNLFYTTLFDTTDRYLPTDSIKAKFAAAGIKPGDELITYCHVGQTACSDYVAAKSLGYTVHLYDGSFEDWSSREDLPLVVEVKKDAPAKPFH